MSAKKIPIVHVDRKGQIILPPRHRLNKLKHTLVLRYHDKLVTKEYDSITNAMIKITVKPIPFFKGRRVPVGCVEIDGILYKIV